MLLKVFDAAGMAYPLVDVKDGRIEHLEDGCDKLIFSLDVRHPIYRIIAEETSIHYDDNAWLVKKIQDDAIECEIDFDFLKGEIKHGYKYQNQLLEKVLTDNLPAGWTIIGASNCTKHRGKTYEHCTPYEAIYDCISKYDVRFVWKTLKRTLEVRVPEKIGTHGVYLSDQLNLKSLAFQGSSTNFATRLYAYGANGLTFAEINGGKDYVENKTYKAKTICAYWVDERYEVMTSLLEAAYEKLEAMAVPERSYECKVQDIEKQKPEEYAHLALQMHDKITLMVSERNLRVIYSIVKYVEYPDDPNSNTVTLSCVPDTIQSYTQALVEANVEDAIVVAEKALAQAGKVEEEIKTVEDSVSRVEGDVVAADEKAQDAFNRAESAFLEAETVEMNVKDIVKGLAVPTDPYYCGDNSPTYGRTYENAVEVMEDGIIYIPTKTHTERYTGETENVIDCGSPSEASENFAEAIYDAGTPESDRTNSNALYAGTPSQRLQSGCADLSFEYGRAYIWKDGGWHYLADVKIADTAETGTQDGDLWYCTKAHTADGVEYQKDAVYRWSAKDGAGLWVAKASKTDAYVYKSLNSLLESVVSITAELKEEEARIELLTAWKTEATQAIASVTQKADANAANITTLLTFMGDSESGAVKAIAELRADVNAHESSIEEIVAWIGDTEGGAVKAIVDVTTKANANAAQIETLVSWVGDSESGATKAIADIKATADANSASIQSLVNWQNEAKESISSLEQSAEQDGAAIELLTQRVAANATNIATVTTKANDNAAAISNVAQTVNAQAISIASLVTKTDEQGASITSLAQRVSDDESTIAEISQKTANNTSAISILSRWKTETDTALAGVQTNIAEIRTEADEHAATITALVTTNEKALALSRDKYVVGQYAPTYGYTYSLAGNFMERGTVYVPTVTHPEAYSSAERYTVYDAGIPVSDRTGANLLEAGLTDRYTANIIDCGSPSARVQTGGAEIVFELGYLYTWNGSGWVKGDAVSLYTSEQEGAEDELWYCKNDITETDAETGVRRVLYSAGTLYKRVGGTWVSVADICNNYAQMAAATIEVQVNAITARVTDAEGNLASLVLRVTETETSIAQLTTWQTTASKTISATETKANANEASINTLATWKSNVEKDVESIASISAKADKNEAQILLKADKTTTLASAEVFYALTDSNVTAPTTGWQTTAPAWESGKFMWQKTVWTYADGSKNESDATCITGATGADGNSVSILGSYASLDALKAAHPTGNAGDGYLVEGYLYVWNDSEWENVGLIQGPAGATGTGISSIQEQYYLSSSNATQTGGSWVTTCPTWESGKYIWTRSKIDWTDGTTSYTTATLAQALNQFGASIEVNTANILLKVDSGKVISTINQSAEAVTIDASKINISGLITAINGDTTTTIDGGKITTGTITADQIDATNLHVDSANIDGDITATAITIKNKSDYVLLNAAGNTVNIGDFTVARNSSRSYIYKGKTAKTATSTAGVYIGTDGISVGGISDGADGYYNITLDGATGKLTANNAVITGTINATAGTIANLTIKGKLYFGNNASYYIDQNYNNGGWYIYLKNFRVDDTTAYFAGKLEAPSGTIGGFTISTSKLYHTQTTYLGTNETAGVYIGTDGIGLGAGAFYVKKDGSLVATKGNFTGELHATSGDIKNLTVSGYLYFGNNSNYYISANYNDGNYYLKLPGLKIDDASGAVFSGKLSGASGTFSGELSAATGSFSGTITTSNARITGGTIKLGTSGNQDYLTISSTGIVAGDELVKTKMSWSGITLIWSEGYDTSHLNYAYYGSHSSDGMITSYGIHVDLDVEDTTYWGIGVSNGIYNIGYAAIGFNMASSYSNCYGQLFGTWKTSSGAAITSDANLKNSIEDLSELYEIAFDLFRARRFKYNDGQSSRYHTGFVAQEVEQAILTAGLTTADAALFVQFTDEAPGGKVESITYALRYEEFISLNTWQIQKLKPRVTTLEEKVEALETKVATLEAENAQLKSQLI